MGSVDLPERPRLASSTPGKAGGFAYIMRDALQSSLDT